MYDDQAERSLRLGMAWFIFSEVIVFGALFAALFYTREISVPDLASGGGSHALLWPGFKGGWPASGPAIEGPLAAMKALGIPALNTIMLLASGVAVTLALVALNRGHRGRLIALLTLTILVGVLFLRNRGFRIPQRIYGLHLTLRSGAYGQTFFILTGLHGVHVAIGTAFMLVILGRILRGDFSAKDHLAFQVATWVLALRGCRLANPIRGGVLAMTSESHETTPHPIMRSSGSLARQVAAVASAFALVALAVVCSAKAMADDRVVQAPVNASMCQGCHGIQGYRTAFPEVYSVRNSAASKVHISSKHCRTTDRALVSTPRCAASQRARAISRSQTSPPITRTLASEVEPHMNVQRQSLVALVLAAMVAPHVCAADDPAGAAKPDADCVACHGPGGNKPITPQTPRLAGQTADYLVEALTQYRNGARQDPVMGAMAKGSPMTRCELWPDIFRRSRD